MQRSKADGRTTVSNEILASISKLNANNNPVITNGKFYLANNKAKKISASNKLVLITYLKLT